MIFSSMFFSALVMNTPLITSAPAALLPTAQQVVQQAVSSPVLVEQVESPYNTILVVKNGDYVTMQFGYRNQRWTESRTNPEDPTELDVEYTRLMTIGLAYAEKVENIVMIGVGGGTTSRYLSTAMPDVKVEAVELDPYVLRMAKKYFGLSESENLELHALDGRMYLRRSKNEYDIIMIDAYRGWFVPFHLLTTEFYEQTKDRLSEGGVVVQNIEPTTMLFDAAIATMKSVYDHVETYDAGGNVVAVAYDGPKREQALLRDQAGVMQDKYDLRYPLEELLEKDLPLIYDPETKPLTDDFAPANVLHNQRK